MKNRTVIVILGALVLLAAFIFFVERDFMTTTERKQREDRLFRQYQRDAVSRLSVTRSNGQTVVLQKTAAQGEDDGVWRIVDPVQRDAEETEVRAMLSAIDFLLQGRTVDQSEAEDKQGFGLEKPRLAVSFEIRGERTAFRIGGDAPGDKVYLAIDGEGAVVHAVAKDILESLDKGVDQLRSKRLSPERLGEAVSMTVHGKGGDYSVSRPAVIDAWHLDTPEGKVLASANAAGELLTHLDGLRAESFVADDVAGDRLGQYGLSTPVATAKVTLPGGKTLNILVGSSCGEGSHNVHLTFEGSGTVACVDEQILRLLSRPKESLLERRPLAARRDEVRKIALRGERQELVLEKKDGTWTAPDHKDLGIEQSSVEGLLESLGKEATQPPQLVRAEPAPKGSVTMELDIGDGVPRPILSLWRDGSGNTSVRRGQEPAILTVGPELMDRARTDVLGFREKTISLADRDKIVSIVTEGPVLQTAQKKDGKWSVVAPIEASADSAAARQLAEYLAEISVERYVSTEATLEHGLNKPFAVLRGVFETDGQGKDTAATKTVELRLGALVPGKTDERFAQHAGDPLVFVVGKMYLEAAERPLLARDVLNVDETAVKRLSITTAARTLTLRLDSTTWTASDGSKVDEERLRRTLTDLGTMKTVRTASFGPQDKALGAPLFTMSLYAGDEDKPLKVLTVFGRTQDSAEEGHYARVEGLDATVVMPKRVVDEILSFVSPAAP